MHYELIKYFGSGGGFSSNGFNDFEHPNKSPPPPLLINKLCHMLMFIYFQTYVQDLVKKNASEIYDMLVNKGGHFFVCGDVSMADDVHTSLEVSFTSFQNLFVG